MEYDLSARGIRLIFNRDFARQLRVFLGEPTARDVMQKAGRRYNEIVLRSPSIGGKENFLIRNVLVAAFTAAIYQSAGGRISPEKMGEIFSNAIGQNRVYQLFMRAQGKQIFTRQWQDKRNIMARESQKRVYPANFVWEFVYGKTRCEYGITYRECAICKLLQRENCFDLISSMCKFDYVTAKYMHSELIRTKTIGNGDGLCDFWFKKKQDSSRY